MHAGPQPSWLSLVQAGVELDCLQAQLGPAVVLWALETGPKRV